ncbi:MAG: hypothetical protein ACXWC3_20100 [Burkholderiales bacterium]
MTNLHTGKKGKGFAGLDALVSDVSDIPEERAILASSPVEVPVFERQVPEPATRAVPPKPQARPAGPAKATDTEKAAYFWVAVCLIIFTIWVFNSGSRSSHHVDAPVLTEAPTQSSPPALEAAPTSPAPAPTALDERMPGVGYNNVLGIPEIRWCQRQQIEIDAIQTIVSDERAYEVEHFNAKVNDYNSRCGNFRYRRGHLEQVQQEFALERESIASKAKSQWMRSALGLDEATEATEAPAKNSEASIPERRVDPPRSTESLSIASLNSAERESIESACSGAKVLEGHAAYEKCLVKKLAALKTAPRNNDLSSLSQTERDSLESACSGPKLLDGPAAYNKCVAAKLTAFHSAPHNIDLSMLNETERTSIESACSGPRLLDGPAAYNKCLASKLVAFRSGPRNIDLSWLNDTERQSLESACSGPRLLDGPAAYNKCLTKKLKQLRS